MEESKGPSKLSESWGLFLSAVKIMAGVGWVLSGSPQSYLQFKGVPQAREEKSLQVPAVPQWSRRIWCGPGQGSAGMLQCSADSRAQ